MSLLAATGTRSTRVPLSIMYYLLSLSLLAASVTAQYLVDSSSFGQSDKWVILPKP